VAQISIASKRCCAISSTWRRSTARASGIVRRWVTSAPEVRVIVTSRTPLGIGCERVVKLVGLTSGAAVEIFVERVRSRVTGWRRATTSA